MSRAEKFSVKTEFSDYFFVCLSLLAFSKGSFFFCLQPNQRRLQNKAEISAKKINNQSDSR